ncbi:MAG: SGNH/GDSL hydrolase family protein, partial [Candidatus Poribacteria bacterium]|nr:SGNH/GDSL hydrolase family protein [Candidatus Poribacteria bacterium]
MKLELKSRDFPVWQGIVSLEQTDNWVKPWRIPYQSQNLFHHQLCIRAAMPAGARIIFRSDTSYIEGEIEPQLEENQIDLYCDKIFIKSVSLQKKDRFLFSDLPSGDKLVELWLPQKGELRLKVIEIANGASLAPVADSQPRWITYGSSITQCSAAESPSQTWPAIVARQLNLNLTCLGFGGQCHLDPIIAQLIRDLPADFISICAGINIYGSASLGPRAFRQALIGTVQTIREKHIDIPVVLISPIYSLPREKAK